MERKVKDVKKCIIEALSKNPEGLTIEQISNHCGLHRHTVSKYVFALKESGIIRQEEFGRSKICILIKAEEGRKK
ncbi:MAG: helix-turn-helix domain-containing protein [Candidatus Aenigmatarchaeota archaeon]